VSDGKLDSVTFPQALLPKFNSARFRQLRTVTY
jgi:hypothetical protein